MKKTESESKNSVKKDGMKSKNISENGIQKIKPLSYPALQSVEYVQTPVTVSSEQFDNVMVAHKHSVNLLDSCGNALLSAMESALPPEGSGRMVGDYTGQNMRQMAKSVCDIVRTKTDVIRSMHSIARDE